MTTGRSFLLLLSLVAAVPGVARAHCDTLDGPVVQAARQALDTGRLNPVLAWVRSQDEAEIRHAFQLASATRRLGPEAKELADRSFFETVVRVHRAGEGAPYAGLKPAGQPVGPAIPAADRAAATGAPDQAEKLLVEAVRHGLRQRLARVRAHPVPGEDVAAGREWVEAYVPYVHYVEAVYAVASGEGHAEAEEPAAPTHAH